MEAVELSEVEVVAGGVVVVVVDDGEPHSFETVADPLSPEQVMVSEVRYGSAGNSLSPFVAVYASPLSRVQATAPSKSLKVTRTGQHGTAGSPHVVAAPSRRFSAIGRGGATGVPVAETGTLCPASLKATREKT